MVSSGSEIHELRVELIFPESHQLSPGENLGYFAARPPRKPGKRKLGQTDALRMMGSKSVEDISAGSD